MDRHVGHVMAYALKEKVAMRRFGIFLLVAVVLVGTVLIGGGAFVTAQETDVADHPIVGVWVVDIAPEDPANPSEHAIIAADGTMVEIAADSPAGYGVWEATGDTTANVTFSVLFADGSRRLVHASVEVAPDGQSFTATYTNEFFLNPSPGESSGEIGPGRAEGMRLVAKGPGTPIASFEEFFGQAEGTPEATPES